MPVKNKRLKCLLSQKLGSGNPHLAKRSAIAIAHLPITSPLRPKPTPRLKQKNLRHAVGYAPDLLPAVVDYAYALLAEDSPRRARKWLLESWKQSPSALLIDPILEAVKPESLRAQRRLIRPIHQRRKRAGSLAHRAAGDYVWARSQMRRMHSTMYC
jgi:uncharacterized membrane-anchored protein